MQQIYLNIIPNGICPRVYVNQYDVGRGIQIKFKDGSTSYGFASGTTFKVNGRKSDGHVFEYTEADKWDATNYIILKSMPPGGATTVYLYTTEQMTAASGEVLMQLTYKLDNAVQGTLNFIMVVQERPEATGDPSESDVPDVVRSVCDVPADADGDANLKWADMSSINNLAITEATRTMTAQRTEGSYVFVKADDQLYKITTTINASGTLSPGTNATACSIGDVLTSLNSDLANIGKLLFSGTLNASSSNVTIDGIHNYNLFMGRVTGTYVQGVALGVRQNSGEIRFFGGALASADATETSMFRLYIDSQNQDKVSLVEVYPSSSGAGLLAIYGMA